MRKDLPRYEPPTSGPLDEVERALVRALVKVFAAELRAELEAEQRDNDQKQQRPAAR